MRFVWAGIGELRARVGHGENEAVIGMQLRQALVDVCEICVGSFFFFFCCLFGLLVGEVGSVPDPRREYKNHDNAETH